MLTNIETYEWVYAEQKKGLYYSGPQGSIPKCCIDKFALVSRVFIGSRGNELVQLQLCHNDNCLIALLLLYPCLHGVLRIR